MVIVPRWLPNAISAARIVLVPVWVVFAELAAAGGGDTRALRGWATATLLTIGLSDVVDGFLARRFGLQSRAGATLDAVADKLAQVVVVGWLALRPVDVFVAIPAWFFVLLVARDVVLLTGTLVVRRRCGGVHVEHRQHGKVASLLLFLVLVAFTAGVGVDVARALLAPIAALVGWSTVLYFRDGWRQVDRHRGGRLR